jgi:pyruvate,orthophosphate dikinase
MTESLQKKRKDLLPALKDNIWPRFKELDSDLKKVLTMWQIMPDGSLNVHEDHEYDFEVIERLLSIHDRLCDLFNDDYRMECEFNGLLTYLSDAISAIDEGQLEFIVGTSVNSYHNLWRELHEDLLCTLGIAREEQ